MIISAPDSHGVGSSSSLTWAQDTRRPVPLAPAIRRNCSAGERSRSSTLKPDAGMPARLDCAAHSRKPISYGAHYCHSSRPAATLLRNSLTLDRLPFNAAGLRGATVRLSSRSTPTRSTPSRSTLSRSALGIVATCVAAAVLAAGCTDSSGSSGSRPNLHWPQSLRRERDVRRGPRGAAELHLPDGLSGVLLDQQPRAVPVPDVAAAVLDRQPQPDRRQRVAEPGRAAGVLQREHGRDGQSQALHSGPTGRR